MNSEAQTEVESAIHAAVLAYFDDCRGRVDGFVAAHFRYPGAWRTNRLALGWDLLRAPINLFWAPFYVVAQLLAWLSGRFRLGWLRRRLLRVPSGVRTRVQRHIADLICTDLLGRGGSADRLTRRVLDTLDDLVQPEQQNLDMLRQLEPVIDDALAQYGLARTASADITNSLTSAALGAFAFKKFTPGGIAVGLLGASWLAQRQAVENFWLGDFLGGLYYRLFPVEPSLSLQLGGVGVALGCLAVFASLSGLITDPIQAVTRLHHHRLHKMIDSLQRDFEQGSANRFRPKDQYLARVLDIMDAAKIHLI